MCNTGVTRRPVHVEAGIFFKKQIRSSLKNKTKHPGGEHEPTRCSEAASGGEVTTIGVGFPLEVHLFTLVILAAPDGELPPRGHFDSRPLHADMKCVWGGECTVVTV